MRNWIVELEPGVWLADGYGEPGHTTAKGSAKRFPSHRSAKITLLWARTFRPLKGAKIVYDERAGQ